MHIGFLTQEYPHERVDFSAGIGSSIKTLASALIAEGVSISIFVYGQKEDAVFAQEGLKFHLIRQQKFKLGGWFLYRKFLQNYMNKFVAIDEIDVIEAPDWTGITAFMKLRCPLVIRMHGSDSYFCRLEKRPQKKKNFWFEKLALQSADEIVSVSEYTARKSDEIFGLGKNIKVIPNAVDIELFSPSTQHSDPDLLLYFGSIIRKKGVLELPQIFNNVVKQRPSTRLLLVGNDAMDIYEGRSTFELFMESLSPEARAQVKFEPSVPYEQIPQYLASAAVVVLPSFAEALPMTWLEAMAMEKALVTSNIGWAREIMINGETGFTIDPRNHQEFAEKILLLLSDKKLRLDMGKRSRKMMSNKFSSEVVAKKNIGFYKHVAAREV